jgi:hypothetical protein
MSTWPTGRAFRWCRRSGSGAYGCAEPGGARSVLCLPSVRPRAYLEPPSDVPSVMCGPRGRRR